MKDRKIILYILIIASYIPVVVAPIIALSNNYFDFQSDFLLITGSILGVSGFIMLFWQYVLGNKSIVRFFTPDFISLNSLHKNLGIYGFFAILLHPLVVFFYYLINLGISIINLNFATKFDLHVKIGTFAFTWLFLTWILNTFLKKKLAYRYWKRIHLLYYFLLPIVYIHADDIGVLSGSTFIGLYIKFLSGLFGLIFIYRILLQLGFFKKKYILVSSKRVTHDVVQLDLKPKDGAIVPLEGQFITLQKELLGETHPFTVAAFDENSQTITIAAKNSGKFSSELALVKPGTEVLLDGPYGVFTREAFKPEVDKIVLIAGGIGITPFLRLVQYISDNPQKFKEAYLFYGNKTVEDIAYGNELSQIAGATNLKLVNVLSQQSGLANYESGYINSDLIRKYIKSDIKDYEHFICGPQVMMDTIRADLIKQYVSIKHIHSEEFSL